MLVLSRKKNESIVINNDIVVTVVEIRGDKVRLGIVVPRKFPCIGGQEVYDAIHGKPDAEPAPPTVVVKTINRTRTRHLQPSELPILFLVRIRAAGEEVFLFARTLPCLSVAIMAHSPTGPSSATRPCAPTCMGYEVYPIHPKATTIEGRPAFASFDSVPRHDFKYRREPLRSACRRPANHRTGCPQRR